MKVRIRRIDKSLPLPEYHTNGAAAFDFYCRETVTVQPQQIAYIPLNVALEPPVGHMLLLASRSGTPKRGIMMANGIGIGDRDFSGNSDEYKAMVFNYTNAPVIVERGDRILQGVFLRCDRIEWEEVDDLGAPDRGGFGTTGK
jgi:dUTP pyrophosphatase